MQPLKHIQEVRACRARIQKVLQAERLIHLPADQAQQVPLRTGGRRNIQIRDRRPLHRLPGRPLHQHNEARLQIQVWRRAEVLQQHQASRITEVQQPGHLPIRDQLQQAGLQLEVLPDRILLRVDLLLVQVHTQLHPGHLRAHILRQRDHLLATQVRTAEVHRVREAAVRTIRVHQEVQVQAQILDRAGVAVREVAVVPAHRGVDSKPYYSSKF